MNNLKVIEQWLNKIKITDDELSLMQSVCPKNDNTIDESLADEYFKRLPYSMLNSNEYDIDFREECTKFIDELFEKYVDDETIVITTDCEHPSVTNNIDKCRNVMYFTDEDKIKLDTTKLRNLKFKKAFVYIIGTHVRNGLFTPQDFYIKIQNVLKCQNVKFVMVIDAVQELFLRPRDYTIFDYVLGTAHAIVLPYDMGIMIHKKDDKVIKHNNYYNNCAREYLKRLDIVLSKKEYLNEFNHIMSEYFYTRVLDNKLYKYGDYPNSAGNLFHIYSDGKSILTEKLKDKWVKDFFIDIDGLCIIRFRAQTYLYKPDTLLSGIKEIEYYLEMIGNE